MEKKRSVGVTIFGWLLIFYVLMIGILLYGVTVIYEVTASPFPMGLDLVSMIKSQFNKISFLKIFELLVGVGFFIVVGVGILKLNNLARKFIVALGWFFIISTPLLSVMVYTIIYKVTRVAFDPLILFPPLVILSGLFFWIPTTYFFTRSKVKEQFK